MRKGAFNTFCVSAPFDSRYVLKGYHLKVKEILCEIVQER